MTPSEMSALEEADLRNRYERGDFHDVAESLEAERLLRSFQREREFLAKCERANLSAALDAKNAAKGANRIAIFAAIMAAIATACSLIGLIR